MIEVDGDQHAEPEAQPRDATRTALLNQQGYRVIGFGNHEVNTNLAAVLDAIYAALANP